MGRQPQQKRAKSTRENIVRAACDIAQTEGCDAVTTTQLAARLGVSVGTIYRYFARREDALSEAYDQVYRQMIMTWFQSLGDISGVSCENAARTLFDNYITAAEGQRAFLVLLQCIREIRSLADDQKLPGMAPEQLAQFARMLGIKPTAQNEERLQLLRHMTTDLSHVYLLKEPSQRQVMYDETIAIISQFLSRMRSNGH